MKNSTSNKKTESAGICFAWIEKKQTAGICFAWVSQEGSASAMPRPTVSLSLENLEKSLA